MSFPTTSQESLHDQPPIHPHKNENPPLFSSSPDLYRHEGENIHDDETRTGKSPLFAGQTLFNGGGDENIHRQLQPGHTRLSSQSQKNHGRGTDRFPYPSSLSSSWPSPTSISINNESIEISTSMSSLKRDSKNGYDTEELDEKNNQKKIDQKVNKSSRSSSQQQQNQQQQQQKQQQHRSNSPGHAPISPASLVVCGVDGTVYTLDAYTGQLRGMFASGSALVASSAATDYKDESVANNADFADDDADEDLSDEGADDDWQQSERSKSQALLHNSLQWKERVVPGLDGRLYSLFEMAQSIDDADVGNDEDQCFGDGFEETEDLDDNCQSSSPSSSEQDVYENFDDVPTHQTSKSIMPRFGTYNLTPLPISVMDVVESPISTCRPIDIVDPVTQEQQRQCGIVVGSKKTTIFALDPTTGKVRWTQDPHGGAGAKGWTTSNPTTAPRAKTVLLQREDYTVRHLDTSGGGEVWKVELGKFSALDFDVDAHNQGSDYAEEDKFAENFKEDRERRSVNTRRRTAAAEAASLDKKEKKKTVAPILGGTRKHNSIVDESKFSGNNYEQHYNNSRKETLFHGDDFHFESDHPQFREFPSIAFGEDGTSIMAVDGMSGEMLWKRRIESVVAAVYGVGKESSWIPLDVIDESSVFTHDQYGTAKTKGKGSGLLASSSSTQSISPSSGGLVPYEAGQFEAGQLHRLGRYDSNLFVSSTFEDVSLDSSSWSEPEIDYHDLSHFEESESMSTPVRPQVNDHGHGFAPSQASSHITTPPEIQRPPSHKTEHGLFLTWPMVSAIVGSVFAVVIFARFAFLRQKRKWENTPLLAPASASNSSEDGVVRSRSNSSGIILPPAFSTSGDPWWKEAMSVDKLNKPYFRSLSLSAMPVQQPLSVGVPKPFVSEKDGGSLSLHEHSGDDSSMIPATTAAESPTPSVHKTSASPSTIPRSRTLPIKMPDEKTVSHPSTPNIDSIDGIPLLRYSRYSSEFKDFSPLGKGGFGTVFRCTNVMDSREYAIKKIWIKSQLGLDGKVTDQFLQKLHRVLREVKILAVLDHPNIVRYYTAWLEVDDGTTAFKSEDDESSATGSLFDWKSSSVFTNSLFSGFGSNSRSLRPSYSPGRVHQRPATKALTYLTNKNPLGWHNFGSFRLDESSGEASSFDATQESKASTPGDSNSEYLRSTSIEEDLGFTWERSEDCSEKSREDEKQPDKPADKSLEIVKEETSDKSGESESSLSSVDSSESYQSRASPRLQVKGDANSSKIPSATNDESNVLTTEGRHILFIQMQLCSIRTLEDFLASPRSRKCNLSPSSTGTDYDIDIPLALRLFSQIVAGVKYVHNQGLIHRDLKPQNCFIDDEGNVKVGDFGLSRESSSVGGISGFDYDENDDASCLADDHIGSVTSSELGFVRGFKAENTAGVGTRAYASPEQMRGSNYDASTDVYSLGLILFELCYPMYTLMEKYQEFVKIRKGQFPNYWNSNIKKSFPTLHDILVRMISYTPSHRPSAALVFEHINSLLAEYSVQSLDKSWGEKGALFIRVEAEEAEGVLAKSKKLIKESAPDAKILQYGLRGQDSKAIMEFALEAHEGAVETISRILQQHDMIVRRISNK
mmetsp:Transcript_30246/g.62949  ORF Transcript_30246/g.62949 Transcript_30246/m.62949 type:complete len:1596 (+) Transcript_30246:455-5242(+)